MGERVTISYRGAAYELGRGKRCYGIWATGAPRTEPVERWPETPDGWVAAWTRFTAMETPGTIAPVGPHQVPSQSSSDEPGYTAYAGSGAGFSGSGGSGPAGPGSAGPGFADTGFAGAGFAGSERAAETLAYGQQTQTSAWTVRGAAAPAFAAALLGIGVICGLVGLFLHYQAGQSLASQPSELIPHVAYLAVWTLAALLIALRAGAVARAGALLAAGTSVMTFGLLLTDLGEGLSIADAGLWITLVGWLACTAGAALAFVTTIGKVPVGSLGARGIARVALLVGAGIGVALTFFPNWDSYLLHSSTTGQNQPAAGGFAFASINPGWVQFADVAVMVLFVLVVVVAALWRPLAAGAMLLAGAVIPMAAQAVSAMVQATEPTSALSFGYTATQVQQLGITVTNGLTPAFWIFCLCVVTLLASCAWMLITPPDRPAVGTVPVPAAGPADAVPVPADIAPAGDAPADAVPTGAVPTGAVPTGAVPANAGPASAGPADDGPGEPVAERELAADSWDDRA
jgi:hypothetical protein